MAMKPLEFEPRGMTSTELDQAVACAGNDGCLALVPKDGWEQHLTWHRNLWRTAAYQVEEATSPLTSNP